jgi:hypothetical protein
MERGLKQRESTCFFPPQTRRRRELQLTRVSQHGYGRVTDLTSHGLTFAEQSPGKEIDIWIQLF